MKQKTVPTPAPTPTLADSLQEWNPAIPNAIEAARIFAGFFQTLLEIKQEQSRHGEDAPMRVTEVHIHLIAPQNSPIGFANVVLDDQLNLCGIGLYERMDGRGYRLTYPLKGRSYAFHPIRHPLSAAIERAVLDALKTVMTDNRHAGYHRANDSSR